MHTALQNALQSQGDQFSVTQYRGVTTVARFSDQQREWNALRSGCGVYDLGFRAKISLAGRDRTRWLNGMVSNNIRDLALDHGVYAFLLNPQGHILGDVYAYNLGESIMLDTDRSQAEKILETFKRYIIMDKVELNDLSEQLAAIGIAGPEARAAMQSLGMQLPELAPLQVFKIQCDCDCGCVQCTVVRGDTPYESYEIWLAPQHVKALWDALLKAGAVAAGAETLELQRIVMGIPLYGVDIRERELPAETGQMRALSFTKGCYIGQEIVERIRSCGNVHRTFTGFLTEWLEDAAPTNLKVVVEGKEVGEITSAVSLRTLGSDRTLALGYVRREASEPGREVQIGSTKATVVDLPLNVSMLNREQPALHR